MSNEDIRILVKDFNFYYGSFQALKNINMEIKRNKVTALIGPSGCGKSTFLRSINRMNDLITGAKYEGEILFDGKNIFDKDYDIVELRKNIGMVFQNQIHSLKQYMKILYMLLNFMEKRTKINLKRLLKAL